MATYVPAKRATELIFYLGLVSQSTGQFQANPTLAAGDVKVSKDGGALANLSTLPAVTPAASKMVKVTLSSTEMTADNVTVVFSDAAGDEWDEVIINIQTAARQIDDLLPTASYAAPDNATITNIQADTNDIQNRLPAALSGDGFIKADLLSINDELTSGNNATLNLKHLNIVNDAGSGVLINGLTSGVYIVSNIGHGIDIEATGGYGISSLGDVGSLDLPDRVDMDGGVHITKPSGDALSIRSLAGNGDAVYLEAHGTGKSINAPQDIAVSDGDLTLANLQTTDTMTTAALTQFVTDDTGETTAASGSVAKIAQGAGGDPLENAVPGSYAAGTAGFILGTNLNATVSSRATQTSVDDLPTSAELTAALDAIPTAAENASQVRTELTTELGRIDAAVSTRATQTSVDTIDDLLDTEVAAIKTETDKIAAVKAKTDSLTFTVSGKVDSNITHVIGDAVQENGADDTEWGGTP
jgi:hypothetical protein